ncbi:MAG: nuclear transport factor 2 family protein, partial [Acinetobacter sp.]
WERGDIDGLVAGFTDDASYIDMPLPPRHGLPAIRAYIERIFSAFSVRIETLRIASSGNIVFTERVDHLRINDGSRPSPPKRPARHAKSRHCDSRKWFLKFYS